MAFGLAFAALGDFFLMLPGDYYFMARPVCFLITHCAYIYALCRHARFAAPEAVFAIFAIAACIIAGLWPCRAAEPHMIVPVIINMQALGIMAARAIERWHGTEPETPPTRYAAWLAAAGGLFFMASGTLALLWTVQPRRPAEWPPGCWQPIMPRNFSLHARPGILPYGG